MVSFKKNYLFTDQVIFEYAGKFWCTLFLFVFLFISPGFSDEHVKIVKFGVFDALPLISAGENGKSGGIFSDVLEAVAKEEGWEIDYVAGTFAECMERAKNGEVDLIGSIMHIEEREEFLDFNENSILNIWGQVYVGLDSKISMIFDLAGKKVGIMQAGAHGANFVKLADTFNIECQIVEYKDFAQITDAILSGDVDAGVYASFHGNRYQNKRVLKQTSIIFNPTELKFATDKGSNQEILNAIDKHFSKWESDSKSVYYEILDNWFQIRSREVLPGWVLKTIYAAAGALLIGIIFIILLRRQVRVRSEALLESRQQQKRIVDNLIDAFLYRHNTEGVFTYVSSSVTEVLGYSVDEFLVHFTKNFTDDPINQDAVKFTNEAIKGNRQPGYEMQVFHKDGSIRWIQVSETPVFDKHGGVIAIEGIAHDVTDRKVWEESLRKLTEAASSKIDKSFFDTISKQLADILNADYVMIGELSGSDRNVVETLSVIADGKPADNLTYNLAGTPCKNVVGKQVCIYPSGVANHFPEDKLLAEMGVEGYAGISLNDSKGKALGIMAALFKETNLNVSFAEALLKVFSSRVGSELERRQGELKLRKAEKRHRITLETSPVCTKIIDLDLKLEYMSSSGYESLKIKDHTALNGKPYPFEFYPEAFKKIMTANLKKSIATGQVVTQEEPVVDIEGNELWFHSTIVPVKDDDGEIEYLVVVSVETTERKKFELEILKRERELEASNQQLKANEKILGSLLRTLKFKNRELQDIVFTASHDLKSPLVNIHGFSGHLVTNCSDLKKYLNNTDDQNSIEKAKEIVETEMPESLGFIVSSVEKMKSLIDGLLRISRIGTAEISKEKIDANALLDKVRVAMEYQLQKYVASFDVFDLPPCLGDEKMLNQVFTNLIDNAIKYRDKKREVVIEVSGQVDGHEVVYCFKDNGQGVDKNFHGKIFEVFHRLNPDEGIDGDGLGLTIVARILDRLGGRIRLESEPGKGCEFYVILPKG